MKNFIRHHLLNIRNLFAYDQLSDDSFDEKYSIETSGYLELSNQDVDSTMSEHGHDYQGTPVSVLKEIIDKIPVAPAELTFIDYGSGLGRTLFASLEIGFKSIIGIEYCEDFYLQTLKNINESNLSKSDKKKLQVFHQDATSYSLPDEPSVLYFFNPFDEGLMEEVVKKIEASIKKHPRILYLVYYNPWYHSVFDASSEFQIVIKSIIKNRTGNYKYYPYVIYKLFDNCQTNV